MADLADRAAGTVALGMAARVTGRLAHVFVRIVLALVLLHLMAFAVNGRNHRGGSEGLPQPLHGHDVTDPAAQGQQGDHQGQEEDAHGGRGAGHP